MFAPLVNTFDSQRLDVAPAKSLERLSIMAGTSRSRTDLCSIWLEYVFLPSRQARIPSCTAASIQILAFIWFESVQDRRLPLADARGLVPGNPLAEAGFARTRSGLRLDTPRRTGLT